jgi:branched-chain amino acid transport system ATP-binding protein
MLACARSTSGRRNLAELLHLEGVSAGYGEAVILEDISLALDTGATLAVLGRNGVGKTTLLRTIMGLTRVHRGRLAWNGGNLAALASWRRARAGLGWVPQERFMFPSLTVDEHFAAVARPGPWTAERVYEIFPALRERRRNLGNQLSGGEQQMVAIGRALMVNPKLLLLDEPMEGLAPIIVQDLVRVIGRIAAEGRLGFILVEQHARLALQLAADAIVLDRGRIVHRGRSAQLLADEEKLQRLLLKSGSDRGFHAVE